MLFSRARMGTNFEVRGEFELARSSTKDFQAGLVMGMPDLNGFDWYSFRMKRNDDEGQVVTFGHGWSAKQISKTVSLNEDRNSFRFRLQNGKAAVFLNEKEAFRDGPLPAAIYLPEGEFLLGIGAFNDMNETVLRYRNVQVRRLPKARAVASE